MKVVINKSVGGFGLSPKAMKRYCELINKPCYFYKWVDDENGKDRYELIENINKFSGHWFVSTSNETTAENFYETFVINERHLSRHDENLIKVVEELGQDADGDYAELKIVDIPDGIEYIVQESDCGCEWIAEKHRTWS